MHSGLRGARPAPPGRRAAHRSGRVRDERLRSGGSFCWRRIKRSSAPYPKMLRPAPSNVMSGPRTSHLIAAVAR